jgi:hypothetical protein
MRICIILFLSITLLFSCQEQNRLPTFKQGAFDLVNPVFSNSALRSFPREKSLEMTENWDFLGWDSIPGKTASFPSNSKPNRVDLPHRLPIPNTNLWYSKKIPLLDGYLWVNADDGSQCWVNDQWVSQNTEGLFPIRSFEKDSIEILIRVINDAASGGLKEVRFIERKAWESHLLDIDRYQNVTKSQAKSSLWNGKSQWVNQPDFPIWITDPVLLGYKEDTIKIVWTGEPSKNSGIFFGSEEKKLQSFTKANSNNGVYTALVPDKDLGFYQVQMDKTYSPIYSSKKKINSSKLKFAAWADSQGGWTKFEEILFQMGIQSPDFTVGVGDLVADGGFHWQYVQLLQLIHALNVPHYLFPGNHDYDGSYNDWIPSNFNHFLKGDKEPNFLFWREGPCAFIGLDPNENFPVGVLEGTEQFEWLTSVLHSSDWQEAKWKIVFVHQPPFSQGWAGYQGEKSIQRLLKPYWESGLIDVVVSGHTHDYERLILPYNNGRQTAFLILGGAGGGIEPNNSEETHPQMDVLIRKHHFGWFEIDDGMLEFKAIDIEGNIIDSFVLTK